MENLLAAFPLMKRDWVTTLWMGPCWNPEQGYCAAGLAWPLFSCRSPFTRDVSIDIMPWASLDTWEGQEVNQAAHGGKKNHSPGAGANKSQWMQKVQRGFIALPWQGLGRGSRIHP